MIKIRVSYNTEKELAGVVRLLSPMLKKYKVQPQKGKYKRAYIEGEVYHENEQSKSERITNE